MYAYIDALIINPEEPNLRKEIKLMIDTGATSCMGHKEILDHQLEITPTRIGTTTVGGNAVLGTVYVPILISFKDSQSGQYLNQIHEKITMGYYEPPPQTSCPEDWLLGQNVLRYCYHRWKGIQSAEIEYPII